MPTFVESSSEPNLANPLISAIMLPRRSAPAFASPGILTKTGVEMRFLAVLVAISALSQSAAAQTGECKSIGDSTARLACYDKAAPVAASASKPAPARTAATTKSPGAKADVAKYVDTISAEDALMNARLKNICRGC
jgi:hypothetical protein